MEPSGVEPARVDSTAIDATWACLVNWNGGPRNTTCVASLRAQGLAPERIVLVDNGSADGSAEAAVRAHPGVALIENGINTGYGHGTNQGIKHARKHGARFVFLVNNDVVVPDGVLPRLLAVMDAAGPELGIVGPRVLYAGEPELVWAAGGKMTWRQNLSDLLGHRKPDGERWRVEREVDYVPGCAMLVREEVFAQVGLLEADYFAYHEDVEFCLKAKEAGFGVKVIGAEHVLHEAHGSTGGGYNPRRKYMMGVNTVWFLRKHGTPMRWLSFLVFDVLSLPLVFVLRALRGEGFAVLAKARGMWHALLGKRVSHAGK